MARLIDSERAQASLVLMAEVWFRLALDAEIEPGNQTQADQGPLETD